MPFARRIDSGVEGSLEPAFARMALPTAARELAVEKLVRLHVLLTGLTRDEGRLLRRLQDESTQPGWDPYPTFVPGNVRKRPGTAYLVGTGDQLARLIREARSRDALALSEALRRLTVARDHPVSFSLEGTEQPPTANTGAGADAKAETASGRVKDAGGVPAAMDPQARTRIMGVVNVTPDSFSDGGRFGSAEDAITHGLTLAEQGADLLDVGGESTRPGAAEVSEEEELARVLPVIEGLVARTSTPVSIDTRKVAVARRAVESGARLVNDVTGLSDPDMLALVAERGVACCVMHMKGTPDSMQEGPTYDDVVEEVSLALLESAERAVAAGVPRQRILLDPGIGFGKTLEHNLALLRGLPSLRAFGYPVLVGTSRKAFLGKLTGQEVGERLPATLGSVAQAALGGADIVRVHDVAQARDALRIVDAIRHAAPA